MLRALLQKGGTRLAWVKAIIGDLVALQAAQPKESAKPHPAGDVDVWIRMAVENRVSWRQLAKPVLTHLGSAALETAVTVPCPRLPQVLPHQGAGVRIVRGCMVSSRSPGQLWTAQEARQRGVSHLALGGEE